MQKNVFLFIFLFIGKILFAQTLHPKVCWTFDGKNTDIKEIIIKEIAEKKLNNKFFIDESIKIAEADVPQICVLVNNNEKWLITPFKDKLENKLFLIQLFFAISLLDLKEEKPFQTDYDVLAVDKQVIINFLTKNFLDNSNYQESFHIENNWNNMEFILEGYNALDSIPFGIYPTKSQRITQVIETYFSLRDSIYIQKFSQEKQKVDSIITVYNQKRINDSIAMESTITALNDDITLQNIHDKPKTKVKWSGDSYNFYQMDTSGQCKKTIFVENKTKHDLYIYIDEKELSPAIKLSYCRNTPIKKGKSCEIIVTFKPSNITQRGDFYTEIKVKGNFEDSEEKILKVKAFIKEASNVSYSNNDEANIAQNIADSLPKTQVQWAEEIYDFKEIKEGEIVKHGFEVKNTGKEDLHITKVKPSCGCTATYCSKDIIKPGESCFIEIEYNSACKSGTQQKYITVTGNFENDTIKILKFRGTVKPDK